MINKSRSLQDGRSKHGFVYEAVFNYYVAKLNGKPVAKVWKVRNGLWFAVSLDHKGKCRGLSRDRAVLELFRKEAERG